MKTAIWFLLTGTCLFQVGCIGLSRQHAVQRWGVHARLVDEADSTPISRRDVAVSIDGQKSIQRTDRKGNLETLAYTKPYWTWLGGPAIAGKPTANISISTVGYQTYSVHWDDRSSQNIEVVRPSLGLPYLDLGAIKLNKRTQAPATPQVPGP